MKLYGYWRSSATYRVRIALNLKAIRYELSVVNIVKDGGEQHRDAFRGMNPMSQVPVLEVEHDGQVVQLAQSIAILEYLEETHPTPALLPRDPIVRAKVRQLAEVVNSGIQPLQNLSVMYRVKNEYGADPSAWVADFNRRGLAAYEAIARQSAGEFSVGDQPTFADCALVPQLYAARRFGVDVAHEFPLLARIDARCGAIEAFAAAHPDRQPDAVAS